MISRFLDLLRGVPMVSELRLATHCSLPLSTGRVVWCPEALCPGGGMRATLEQRSGRLAAWLWSLPARSGWGDWMLNGANQKHLSK